TVPGTGTERAGTSRVCAWAEVKDIAAHNIAAPGSLLIATVLCPAAGIASRSPVSFLLSSRDDARPTFPQQPLGRGIIPQAPSRLLLDSLLFNLDIRIP